MSVPRTITGPSIQSANLHEMQERLFHDALWSAFLTLLRAYGKRYGYCVDIKVIKDEARTT